MTSPTVRASNKWPVEAGDDILQIVGFGGVILGGIDSTCKGFGGLSGGVTTNPAGIQGDLQLNNNGVFGTANDVWPGASINFDLNIGSGLSVNLPVGGVTFQSQLGFDAIASECTFEATEGNVQFTADIASVFFNAGIAIDLNAPTQILLTSQNITFANLPVFANNAAAQAGGLFTGSIYRTGADPDQVCIVHA